MQFPRRNRPGLRTRGPKSSAPRGIFRVPQAMQSRYIRWCSPETFYIYRRFGPAYHGLGTETSPVLHAADLPADTDPAWAGPTLKPAPCLRLLASRYGVHDYVAEPAGIDSSLGSRHHLDWWNDMTEEGFASEVRAVYAWAQRALPSRPVRRPRRWAVVRPSRWAFSTSA